MRYKGGLDGIVLGSLQTGPAHGYEIVKRVRDLSGGELGVAEAKLYPCLHRLEEQGYVTAEWIPQEGKPARKVYSLTEEGKKQLASQRKSWEKYAQSIGSVLAMRKEALDG